MKRILSLPGILVVLFSLTGAAVAQDPALSAKALAGQLSEAIRDGSSIVRLKLEGGKPDAVLQLQVKSRRTAAGTDLQYQVLWPKERKGEGFTVRKTPTGTLSGSTLALPDKVGALDAGDMEQPVFGSELTYSDLVENFYAWDQQTINGQETVDRVACVILESKPAGADRSSLSLVRSWIDPKRLVPLRIEKFNRAGQMTRRITTTRVAKDDNRRSVAASFTVQRAGQAGVTTLEGSNIKHDVTLQDRDFTVDGLRTPAK